MYQIVLYDIDGHDLSELGDDKGRIMYRDTAREVMQLVRDGWAGELDGQLNHDDGQTVQTMPVAELHARRVWTSAGRTMAEPFEVWSFRDQAITRMRPSPADCQGYALNHGRDQASAADFAQWVAGIHQDFPSTLDRHYARWINRELTVTCDECGNDHQAEPAHEGRYGEGRLYAVVCTRDHLTDYYTAERINR